ncbi:uncharacterized protein LOC100177538 [Ciona intestinalis]
MNLLADYDSDSEDEKPKAKVILPSADKVLKSASQSSLFTTRFDKAEQEDREVLEHHVTMVESKDKVTNVGGRKVCWMYRKGRCRFGKKCQMFHDSELREQKTIKRPSNQDQPISFEDDGFQIQTDQSELPKKKRYGVTNTLAPPNKALAQIKRIKKQEQYFDRTKKT